MPKAGIHSRRSTNWYSGAAADGSKAAHSQSVSAKVAREATSATWRTRASRSPSRPTSRTTTAAASGRKTIAVRIGNDIGRCFLSPEVVAHHQDDAQEQRRGVHADRARLEPPEQRSTSADDQTGAVDGSVDDARVS